MANVDAKVEVRHLAFQEPPLPKSGGRIHTPAGELAQIINGEAMRLVTYIEFLPDGKPRGNHVHHKKEEIIYVIKGRLRIIYEDIEDHSRKVIEMRDGDLVRVQPNCAHVYIAEEYTQALELNSVPYDPSDTIPYEVRTDN